MDMNRSGSHPKHENRSGTKVHSLCLFFEAWQCFCIFSRKMPCRNPPLVYGVRNRGNEGLLPLLGVILIKGRDNWQIIEEKRISHVVKKKCFCLLQDAFEFMLEEVQPLLDIFHVLAARQDDLS
jgi:hypothetical protein